MDERIAGESYLNITNSIKYTPEGGNIEIRLESENGLLIGTLNVVPTGDWDSWKTITTDVAIPNTGIFDLYFVFKGNKEDFVHIDYWEFTH